MKVFLIRHGTRNFTTGDVPLNEEGMTEARDLAEEELLTQIQSILCSPKQRARMTVSPLSKKLGIQPQILEDLDQMKRNETELEFKSRVQNIIDQVTQRTWTTPLLICSHSDWLGMATQLIPSDEAQLRYHMFRCAEHMEFNIEDGLWLKK